MPRYFNSAIKVNRVNYFSSSVFTVPPGVSLVYVTLIGAGGGGGSVISGTNATSAGGGGGAFCYVSAPIYVRPTESIFITIPQSVGPDQNGGSASFGSYIFALGGSSGSNSSNANGLSLPDSTYISYTRGGRGGGYGVISSSTSPTSTGTDIVPESNAYITQSFGGGLIPFVLAAGGTGGNGFSGSSAIGGDGGIPRTFTFTPYQRAAGGTTTGRPGGGGGGGSPLGRGGAGGTGQNAQQSTSSGSAAIGYGAGGGGAGSIGNASVLVPGGSGSAGFCSISWD